MIIPALNAGAVQDLPPQHINQGSSAVNFMRQLGGAFGVNLLATFLEWRTLAHAPPAGLQDAGHAFDPASRLQAFQESFAVIAIVFALTVVPAWLMGKRRESR
jgi:hypothetical protein